MYRTLASCCILAMIASSAQMALADAAPATQPAWASYVHAPDSAVRTIPVDSRPAEKGRQIEYKLISQHWHDVPWAHTVQLLSPNKSIAPDTALLFLDALPDKQTLSQAVDATGIACAWVSKVPSASFGKEPDRLWDYSVDQFYKTGEPDWLLLAPICKAVVSTMDTLAETSQKEMGVRLTRFILVGHGHNGLAAWMVPLVDPRVVAIVPIGTDELDQARELEGRLGFLGSVEQRARLDSPIGRAFLDGVDPIVYRNELTFPKLLINGTNDQRTHINAVNIYWDALPETKALLMLDNAEHHNEVGNLKAVRGIYAFARAAAQHQPFPEITWKFTTTSHGVRLDVAGPTQAKRALLFTGEAVGSDSLKLRWEKSPMGRNGEADGIAWTAEAQRPLSGLSGAYAEVQMEFDAHTYWLTTSIYTLRP